MINGTTTAKGSYIMGVSATAAICGVVILVGKLYFGKLDDIQHDISSMSDRMAVDDQRELADAERFGRILSRLDALEK